MTIFIIIYLIGFLLTYYITRKYTREAYINNWGTDERYSWYDVKETLIISLFSWIVILVVIVFIMLPDLNYKIKTKTKPPRFL